MLRFIEGFLLLALQACGVAMAGEGEAPYVVEGEEVTREMTGFSRRRPSGCSDPGSLTGIPQINQIGRVHPPASAPRTHPATY